MVLLFLKIKYIISFGKTNCKKKNIEVKNVKTKDDNILLYKLRNLSKLFNSSVFKFPDSSKTNPFFENNLVRFNLLK